jgi:3-methyladenine DNA glycosylase AlkD
MSEPGSQADVFVSAHLDAAAELGRRLSDLIDEPAAFLGLLRAGLEDLADAEHRALVERLSPGTPARYIVRAPLAEAIRRPLEQALQEGSSIPALQLAQHLAGAEERDLRLFALPCLRRSLHEDPEQTWQLLRRMGRVAGDWVEVDSLADLWARGILAERFRWAELEQLLYSQRTFERRLVGATLATIPHRLPRARRDELRPQAVTRALEMIRLLMGDAEVMVQRSLSWAIREWSRVDALATAELLRAETAIAVERRDGARAWVVRDALSNQPAALARSLRRELAGIRRDRRQASTSIAAGHAAGFAAVLTASNDVAITQGDRYMRSRA